MIRAQSLVSNDPVDWRRVQKSVWVDVERPSDEELQVLKAVFPFNPLALEDALTEGQWSRFEAYPEHIFLVFRTLRAPQQGSGETERVSLFWYPATDTLVTFRRERVDYLDRTWAEFEPLTHGGEERLIYTLLSQGADTFFTFADVIGERTDALEEEMFTTRNPRDFAKQVFEYKHLLMNVRRLVSNARESVAGFARHAMVVTGGEGGGQAQQVSVYFRDIVDTLSRVHEMLDSGREVLSSVLDANLGVQQGRVNEVVKTLTTVSTIFLPLTFLAGVWGMNFAHIPELHWKYGYAFAWLSFIVVAACLVVYFRRRGWW